MTDTELEFARNMVVYELADRLEGVEDTLTKVGRIDVLTDHQIVQVEQLADWKTAMANVLANHHFHPDKEMRVHLFNHGPPVPAETIAHAMRIMDKHEIMVTCEEDILYGLFPVGPHSAPPPVHTAPAATPEARKSGR